MADKFRRLLDDKCGKGGVKCYCCNPYKGKHSKKKRGKLNRIIRQKLKTDATNEVNNDLHDETYVLTRYEMGKYDY